MFTKEERKFYIEEILSRIFVLDRVQFDEHFSKDKETINYLINNVSETFLSTNKFLIEMIVNYIKNNPTQSKSDLIMIMPLKQFLHIVKLEMNKDLNYKPKVETIEINNSNDIKEINELGDFVDEKKDNLSLKIEEKTKTNIVSDKLTSLLAKVKGNDSIDTIESKIEENEVEKKSKLELLKDNVKSGTDMLSKIINLKNNDSKESNIILNETKDESNNEKIIKVEEKKLNLDISPINFMEKITKVEQIDQEYLNDIPDYFEDIEISEENNEINKIEIIESEKETESFNIETNEIENNDLDNKINDINYDDYENINYDDYEEEEIDYGDSFYDEEYEFKDNTLEDSNKIEEIEDVEKIEIEKEEIKEIIPEEVVSFAFDIDEDNQLISNETLEENLINENIKEETIIEENELFSFSFNIVEDEKEKEIDENILKNKLTIEEVNEKPIEEVVEINLIEEKQEFVMSDSDNNENIVLESKREEDLFYLNFDSKTENKEENFFFGLNDEKEKEIDVFSFIVEEKNQNKESLNINSIFEEKKENDIEFNFDSFFNKENNVEKKDEFIFNLDIEKKDDEVLESNEKINLVLNLENNENKNIINKENNLIFDLNLDKFDLSEINNNNKEISVEEETIDSLKLKVLELEKKVSKLLFLEEKINEIENRISFLIEKK